MTREISSPRVQRLNPLIGTSPYFVATERAGCRQYTIYNHMYFPYDYGQDRAEVYEALTNRATLADVGAERQVAISGPDALSFADYLVTRDISGLAVGACTHSVCCDDTGKVITDPVILRVADDEIWLSGSDADLILWAKGVALGAGCEATVSEPDCAPLQVQGPLSGKILEGIVEPSFESLKRFECMRARIGEVDIVLARLGWSREFGYEVFPLTSEHGLDLWERIVDAGRPHGLLIAPPSHPNAVESGITTCCYGSTRDLNALELWRRNTVDFGKKSFVGREALLRIAEDGGPKRKVVGLCGPSRPLPVMEYQWQITGEDSEHLGVAQNAVYSPTLERAIALALIRIDHSDPGLVVSMHTPDGPVSMETTALPFIARRG